METLEDYVAQVFGVRTNDLFTTNRKREVVDARKVCMAVMRDFTSATVYKIANHFNMGHCMTIYNVREVKKLYQTNRDFRNKVDQVYDRCNAKTLLIPLTFTDDYATDYVFDYEESLIELQ